MTLDIAHDRTNVAALASRTDLEFTLPPCHPHFIVQQVMCKGDAVMNESFLQQLEQRTEQVKITLANLEAERVRIEGQIARLQPIVPHYDALLAAERSLADADITLHTATLAAPEPPGAGTSPREDASGWYEQHAAPDTGEQPPPEHPVAEHNEGHGW
jgi:hypothetical protein